MKEIYSEYYRILGIQPDSTWKQLRQAYKKQVNIWHPDRFQQNVQERKVAEEKTKQITQAYKGLADYYKKHGSLPISSPEADISGTEFNEPQQSRAAESPIPETPTAQSSNPAETSFQQRKSILTSGNARILAIAGIILALYALLTSDPPRSVNESIVSGESTDSPRSGERKEDANPESGGRKRFGLGATLGEVYTIQGVPDRTEDDVWYYGDSKIFFFNGRVSGWEEGSRKLNSKGATISQKQSPSEFFRLGSSKQEVLAVQGPPDRDSGNVWDYGSSRVYFKNDKVTGWHEAPFDSLKARR